MKLSRMIGLVLAVATTALANAQGWSDSYDNALKLVKQSKFIEARAAFQQASMLREEDFSGPTVMPGPVTEQHQWRKGAPYSPNFGAAYSGFHASVGMEDADRSAMLKQVAKEFETLLSKGQNSRETYYFLYLTYTQLQDLDNQQKLSDRYGKVGRLMTWKVDQDMLAPEEISAIKERSPMAAQPKERPTRPAEKPKVNPAVEKPVVVPDTEKRNQQEKTTDQTKPKRGNPTNPANPPQVKTNPNTGQTTTGGGETGTRIPTGPPETAPLAGPVPTITTKYALLVGNSESKLPEGGLPYAASDVLRMREALIQDAGYSEANIDVVANATAAQILASAKALAQRMPDDATLFIYFTGAGTNFDGKDYLVGVDTELSTDTSTMLAKNEIYKLFMSKGARIFAFFQANRPIVAGRYFGMEIPLLGAISQMQATIPGESVYSIVKGGKTIGLFTEAVAETLNTIRSNRIPILDFGWEVFYMLRRGELGSTGGSSRQTPTLPVRNNLGEEARF